MITPQDVRDQAAHRDDLTDLPWRDHDDDLFHDALVAAAITFVVVLVFLLAVLA